MKAFMLRYFLRLVFVFTILCTVQGSFAQGVTLILGNTNAGTISLPGQEDRFTFTGSIGQRLYYDAFDLDFEPINARLVSPSGVTLWEINHSSSQGPFYLTETGTYTLLLDGSGDTAGDYTFRLLDLAGATVINYDATFIGQLAPQSGTMAYLFSGTNGQRLNLQSIAASSGDAYWRLVSAADQTLLGAGAINADLGEVVLPATGTYLVLVEGFTENIGVLDYQFRVSFLSNPSGAPSGFGILLNGDTAADQTNDFAYSAPAGLPVYLDSQTNISPVTIYFIDPSNSAAFTVSGGGDSGPYLLPSSGNYTLRVVGNDTGSYSLRLLNLTTSATDLVPGVFYTSTLNPAFRTDAYRFTGATGQRIYYDALDFDYDAISAQLIHPNGGAVYINGNADWDSGPFTLNQPGTYYLLIASQSAADTADYGFRLLDTAQAPASTLTLNGTTQGTNDPGSAASVYRFSGTNGQRLFLDFSATNSAGNWYLFGPSDQVLTGGSLSGDAELLLSGDGNYMLVAGNSSVMDLTGFSLRVLTPVSTTNALTLGATVAGTLTQAGEEHRFTFGGELGQRLYYDALRDSVGALTVQLISPSGAILYLNGNSDYDNGPFTLTESGTYALTQKATTEAVGSYGFRLIDLAQSPATPISLDAQVNGVVTPGTSVNIHYFTGSAGQRLFFDAMPTNAAGSWSLFGPENQGLNANSINGDFEVTLTQGGIHALVVGNSGNTNSSGYSIRIITPTTTSNPVILGATVAGSLDEPGEEDRFTFTGTVGQRLYYDALEADFDSISVQLYDPNGTIVLLNGNSDYDAGPFTLGQTGTYTLLQKGSGDYTNDYRFRLLDLGSGATVSYGAGVTNQLSPQIGAQLYRINGTAGERIGITNFSASSANANWSLFGPANVQLLSDNVLNDLGEVTLPTSGTYALVVAGNADLIGGLDYQFQVSLIGSASGGVAGFGTAKSGNTTAGQTNSYSYTAPAGLPVYFDALTNNSPVIIEFIGPGGTAAFTVFGSSDVGPFFLPESGDYTMNVIGFADGSFDFRLLNLNVDSTSLTFGTTYTQTLNPSFRTDLYTISVTNGQRLYYDGLDTDGDSVAVRLYSPSGAYLTSANSDYDAGPLTMTEPGTAFLAVASEYADDTADYAFRLLDAAQSPVATLTLDTSVAASLDPGSEADVYRFTGSAGARLYFDAATTNGFAYWSLYGPFNQYMGGSSLNGDFEVTLLQTGEYLLVAGFNNATAPTAYSFRVVTPEASTNVLTLGATVAGSLTEPGEEAHYKFTGSAGQRLYFDALDSDGDFHTATLLGPSGYPVFSTYAESDFGLFTLTYSGEYTLLMKGSGDAVGDYRFRILDSAVAPVLSLDTVITNNITNTFGAAIYRLPVLVGLRLITDWVSTPNGSAYYTVYSPNNAAVASGSFGYESEFTPLLTGTNLLVLSSAVANNVPYSFQIIPGNHAPVLATIGNRTNNEMTLLTFTASATDLEAPNDQLTFSLDPGAPTAASINPVTGVFTWTPDETNGPGVYPVTVRVTDNGIPNFSDSETFSITVNEVNRVPLLTVLGDQIVNELVALNLSASATDPDVPTNALTFSLISPPSGMTINATSGDIAWTPSEAQGPFTNAIIVVVTDTNPPAVNAKQLSATNTFQVTVNEVNVAPVLAVQTNRTINELALLTVTNTATDSDLPPNGLSYELTVFPPGATISSDGIITWTPTEVQGPSTNIFTTVVTDTNLAAINAQNLTATNTFTVFVNEVNVAPTTAVQTNRTINELTLLTVTNTASDMDSPSNDLGYALTVFPPGATISTEGIITWTPNETQGPSTNIFTTVVTDTNLAAINAQNLTATNTFTVFVNEVNVAPTLAVQTNRMVSELTLLTVTNTASDADSPTNGLGYTLTVFPPGAAISSDGIITWTPTEAQGPSSNIFTTVVTDTNLAAVNSQNLTATNTFTVFVNESNVAPVLTLPSSQAINELVLYSSSATATDADSPANPLVFALVSGPSGLNVSSAGAITWTPTEAQGPGVYPVQIRVTDTNPPAVNATSLSVTSSFTLTVDEVNLAPTLLPPANRTIHAGTTLFASAIATDPDIPANTFTYAKVSGPAGVIVSAGGLIRWNTSDTDASTTNVISLRVTDGGTPGLGDTNSFVVIVDPRPMFTSIVATGGVATAVWTAIPGISYRLQYKTNLADVTWDDLAGDVTAAGTTASKADGSPGTNATRFYRVFVLP